MHSTNRESSRNFQRRQSDANVYAHAIHNIHPFLRIHTMHTYVQSGQRPTYRTTYRILSSGGRGSIGGNTG